jgi:hypothetical protein
MQVIVIPFLYFQGDSDRIIAPFIFGVIIWAIFCLLPMRYLIASLLAKFAPRRHNNRAPRPKCAPPPHLPDRSAALSLPAPLHSAAHSLLPRDWCEHAHCGMRCSARK